MKNIIDNKKAEKFFYSTSKWIIFVPIVIIVISLVLKLTQSSKTIGSYVNPYTSVSPTPQMAKIDLAGPYKCEYKDGKNDVLAYIKDGKVTAMVGKDEYDFDGDCVIVNGVKKTCNLKSYTILFSTMIASRPEVLESAANQYLKEKIDIQKVLQSCKKEEFSDSVFKK